MDLKVLEKVTYADGSFTKFHYNGYAQVWKVEEHAADSGGTAHVLSHVRTNIESPAADQTDVPRFTQVWNKVENFNSGNETTTTITRSMGQSYTSPAGGSAITATKIEVAMTGHPHNAISKSWYGESGWKDGIPLATEDWADGTSGSERKRWTLTNYTQDDTGVAYQTNPRVVESKVGDGTNTKRTTIDYVLYDSSTIAAFGLPSTVKVYDSDQTTVLKQSDTLYNFDANYISRRIAGLPVEVEVQGYNQLTSSMELVSRVTFAYDEGNFSDSGLQQTITPTQHDATNYGSGFAYRGNLTSTTRWDVTQPTNGAAAITSSMKYNTAGSPVAKITPWDGTNTRTVKIGYADSWNSTGNPTTYAYPTSITDPANNSSTVKYRYDIGANVEANSPAPAGQTYGKTSKRVFDSIGRLQKNSVYIDTTEQSYTRYEYPTNGVQSRVFSTLVDTNSNGPDSNDEVLSERWFDGAGRVRRSRVPHTFSGGSTVTWAGTLTEYDILGRVYRTSVPTEVDNSFAATGDDYARGFIWNQQEYDWMGRTTRTIPSDSNGTDGKDTLISYAGCGCAGGLETTVQGPLVPRTDTTGDARRKQKSFADILGRTWKTQTFKWDGSTAYLTTETSFNGRDQVVSVTQTDENSVVQTTTATFDGHGRLYQSHRPEQRDNSNNLKYTTYSYNADDSILSVTDGRGAVTNLAYNNLGLLTGKSWTVPGGSGITDPTDVIFSYDNLGNRTQMTDGLGTQTYEYNSLSQLMSETRDFTDTLANAPISGGKFKLEYTYALSGQLRSLKDPYGQQFNYGHDKAGRLQTVTGSTAFNGITNYASSPVYNARGNLTGLSYGNGTEMNVTGFNNKLQATGFEVKKGTTQIIDKEYEFYNDGSLKFIDDGMDQTFDRLYKYDHQARTVKADAGTAARGETSSGGVNLDQPYTMQYTHGAFGQIESMDGYYYNTPDAMSHSYVNNRNLEWQYDNDGNEIADNDAFYKIDAAGNLFETTQRNLDDPEVTYPPTVSYFDGDGQLEKRTRNFGSTTPAPVTNYYILSSILKKVVSETDSTGKKLKTHVPANGVTLAEQNIFQGTTEALYFVHQDASGSGVQQTKTNGDLLHASHRTGEYDPIGRNIGDPAGYVTINEIPPGSFYDETNYDMFGSGQGYRPGQTIYRVDGQVVPHSYFFAIIDSGLVGGAMRLLETTARLSARRFAGYSLRFGNGDVQFAGYDFEGAVSQMEGGETLIRNWYINDSWSVGSLISSNYRPARAGVEPPALQPRRARWPSAARITSCLSRLGKMYGNVKVKDLWGTTNVDNSFTRSVEIDGKPYTIETNGDVSAADLGHKWEADNRMIHEGRKESGYTSHYAMLGNVIRNSVAKEVFDGVGNRTYSTGGLYAVYHHELGNAVALAIFNTRSAAERAKLKSPFHIATRVTEGGDDDAGVVFERCLYGGIVDIRNNTVGNSRNF